MKEGREGGKGEKGWREEGKEREAKERKEGWEGGEDNRKDGRGEGRFNKWKGVREKVINIVIRKIKKNIMSRRESL